MNSLQKCCSIPCAIEYVKIQTEKKKAKEHNEAQKLARAELKKRKEALKSRSDWMKDAQTAFNAWIRWRDRSEPCISCGCTNPPNLHGGQWDAGHYLSVGSHPELRFNEANCHKQCKSCNAGAGKYARKNHTVAQEYRIHLIERVGADVVEALEGPHEPAKYTIDELKAIRDKYRKMLRCGQKSE